ncbi:MAG: dihydropteroate synthase [Anaerolineales bacterium]|jgi:5-methyltetrahydrofolate--homocysteine methyltransferase
MSTLFQGRGSPVSIGPGDPVRIIGERINPSGRVKFRQALLDGEWEYLTREALKQVEAGTDILDVNIGAKGIDETIVLPEAVKRVAEAVEVPLSIDTRNPAALEAALKVCPGRPLVNSIGGEEKILKENLPIVAVRGAGHRAVHGAGWHSQYCRRAAEDRPPGAGGVSQSWS